MCLVPGAQSLTNRFLIIVILLLSLPALAAAQGSSRSRSLDDLQEKADTLFRQGHWERAHFIYVNELAARGDKFSQYMAGYMYHEGRGVERDPVRALAWYRLAAENGAPEFIELRDGLLVSLSEESLETSDAIYIELRRKYSDLALALGLVRDEREALNEPTTGSRISNASTSVTIIDPHGRRVISRAEYERRLKSRIKLRLDYITKALDIEELDADLSDKEFGALADQVERHLEVINDR